MHDLNFESPPSASLCCFPPTFRTKTARYSSDIQTSKYNNEAGLVFLQLPLVEISCVAHGVHCPCVKQYSAGPRVTQNVLQQELMVPVSKRNPLQEQAALTVLYQVLKILQAWSSDATRFPPLCHKSSAKK